MGSKHLKTWDYIKNQKHDLSNKKNPANWLWLQNDKGVYIPYSEINSHLPYYVRYCEVCGCKETFISDNLEVCSNCGSEWNVGGELTLDVRDFYTYNEIVQKGWAIDLTNK